MISTLLFLGNWINLLGKTVVSAFKCLFLSRSVTLYNPHSSRELVILGNGPSLNYTLTQDLDKLANYELLAVNLFACSEAYNKVKPTHYVWLDPALRTTDHPASAKARQALLEHTHWPLTLWVPAHFRKEKSFLADMQQNANIRVQYFNYVICEGFTSFLHPIFDRGWGMPQCQNVLIAAVFLGIRAGFGKIWITGADHTWHEDIRLNEKNELQVFDNHFYEKEKNITGIMTNHPSTVSYLSRAFLSLHKVYRGYEVVAEYAQKRKVAVVNASKKSYIDVFPKLPLE